MTRIVAVIPARYASSRFPGKPLQLIAGKPMIQRVYERVKEVQELFAVYVATDDLRIQKAVLDFGGKVIMTGACNCGSERVYEAIKDIECDIVLNIQGDEPLIKRQMIMDLIDAFDDETVEIATLKKEIFDDKDIYNPNIAKLITDNHGNAIYFSRSTIPYDRDKDQVVHYYKHIGIYGYRKSFLAKFVCWPQSFLEKAEQLEQLRVLENGHKIRAVETQYDSIGVDLPEHIEIIEKMLMEGK